MTDTQRIVIVGATSGIALHCARRWAEAGGPQELILVGRDAGRLERTALDLKARNAAADTQIKTMDFLDPAAIGQLADAICATGRVDIVLIAHGELPDQEQCQNDLAVCRDAMAINALSPVLFAEAFAGHMAKARHGHLAVIGSVAGDRGRASNYIYGAAKGLLERYVEGLRHRMAATGWPKVTLIKPGPTDTPMTAALKSQGARMASPDAVAGDILRGIAAGKATLYTPAKWRLIMLIIRLLPDFIFNRLKI